METWGTGEKNDISTVRFKSYYVVWKLEIKKKIAYMETEFKSYYVVWKRQIFHFFIINWNKFKSYYVVWKLSKLCCERSIMTV